MGSLASRLARLSFPRFLVSGGINTALTYGLYLLLLMIGTYQVSYTIAYLVGIVVAFLLNRHFVFQSYRGIRSVLLFPLVYVAQYLLSMLTLWVWVDQLKQNAKLGPLIAIVITVPITYLMSKYIFVGNRGA